MQEVYALGSDPSDLIAFAFGKPQVSVGTSRDTRGSGVLRNPRTEFRDRPCGRRTAELVAICLSAGISRGLSAPQTSIASARDAVKRGVRRDSGAVLGHNPGCRDLRDLICAHLGKPQITVWTQRYAVGA